MNEGIRRPEKYEHPALVERYTEAAVEILTIGRPLNGRLLFSTTARAEEIYPGSSELRRELLQLVAQEAIKAGVTRLAVLRVDGFTASLTTMDTLPTTEAEVIVTDDGAVTLLRGDEPAFFHDGIILVPGEGALIITGDCHTITAWSEEPGTPVVATHAGRNSLHTINHTHTSGSESVVTEVINQFSNPRHVHLRSVAGIGPNTFTHPLNHPTFAEQNQKLVDYFARFGGAKPSDPEGRLDLATAITEQAKQGGVPADNITNDGLDTTADERLWSNRRDGKPRNTILVLHKQPQ
jgi:hypothetical protein